MITMDDLEKAASNLDKMYKNEVLPKVKTFRKAWDELTLPFTDENLRLVAKRHNIDFVPNDIYAYHIFELVCVSRPRITAFKSSSTQNPFFRFIGNNGEPCCLNMVEVCGHDTRYTGYWDGTMWCVIRGKWRLADNSYLNSIYEYLVKYRKLLQKVLDQYDWFVSHLDEIAAHITKRVNYVVRLDEEDTKEFNEMFNITPKTKRIKITVKVEEI